MEAVLVRGALLVMASGVLGSRYVPLFFKFRGNRVIDAIVRAFFIVLLLSAIVYSTLISTYLWHYNQRTPTSTDLAGMSRSHIPLKELLYVESNEGEFYLWISTLPRIGVPSGPSAYVFDSEGKLLDWAFETADGSSIDSFYYMRDMGASIRIERALKSIRNVPSRP